MSFIPTTDGGQPQDVRLTDIQLPEYPAIRIVNLHRKIIACKVIQEDSSGDLNKTLESMITAGWQPLGRHTMFLDTDDDDRFRRYAFSITMVKYTEPVV